MKRRIVIVPLVAALLAGLTSSAPPACAQALVTLHVATTPIDTGAQVYYAIDMGLFRAAGLDVQVASISAGPAIAAGVAGGTYEHSFRAGLPQVIAKPT